MKLIERRKEEIVEKDHKDQKQEMKNNSNAKDLLGLMIEGSRSSSNMITAQDIVEECKSFFFAGKQTTSNLLTWTTVLLAMHPQWQVRARDELLRVCGARDIPTKDDVVKLKTVIPLHDKFPFFFFVSYPARFSLSSL